MTNYTMAIFINSSLTPKGYKKRIQKDRKRIQKDRRKG